MRIALSFPGCHRLGGVERVVLETANFLDRRGHEVHLFASEWDDQRLRPGVKRHAVPLKRWIPFSRTWGFARAAAKAIMQSGLQFDAYGAWGVIAPPGGLVWVQSVHRAWLDVSRQRRGGIGRLKQRLNLFHPAILALERARFGGGRYDRLLALTPDVKQDLIRCYGVPEEDIEVLPNGFSPEEFNPERARSLREPVRRELGYEAEDRVVLFVANELERKGFGPLLRAVASLNDQHVHLLAVGRLDAHAYAGEIQRLRMKGRVQFTGPTSDAARYDAAADLFALPTQYEAWGLVIVEALACGLPVVTSRLAGASAAVHEGVCGFLIEDPHDSGEIAGKLVRGLQCSRDPDSVAASVSSYAWSVLLQRYEALLADLTPEGAAEPVGVSPSA